MTILFGFESEIPTNLKRNPEPLYNMESYCDVLRYKLRIVYKIARENLNKRKIAAKKHYDKSANTQEFKVGDKVLQLNKTRTSKLDPKYIGPFEVTKVDNERNVTINTGKRQTRIHKNLLKLCK